MSCNVDVGHSCDAGPDGEPCAECAAWFGAIAAEAWLDWQAASPEQRHPKRFGFDSSEEAEEAALRDAGRIA